MPQQFNFWQKSTFYALGSYILDGAGNIQTLTAPLGGGMSGSITPVWTNTTTSDNGLTWAFVGVGAKIAESQKPNASGPFVQTLVDAVSYSRGSADAGKLVLLSSDGKLDASVGGGGGGGGGVASVFGRAGAVIANAGDYGFSEISGSATAAQLPAATSGAQGAVVLTGDFGGTASSPTVVSAHLSSPLPVNQGGSGTANPGLVEGTNITVTGTWPDQTVSSTYSYSLPSATSVILGGIQLAGDLGNTAASPEVYSTHLSPPLPVDQGGTGGSTLAVHGVLVGEGTNPVNITGTGTVGQVLTSNGSTSDPSFQALPVDTDYYQTVEQAGSAKTQRADLNFLGPITATDNAGNTSTDILVPDMAGAVSSPPANGAHGLVPQPYSGDAATKFLKADGTWAVPSGSGVALAGDLGNTTASPQVVSTHLASPLPVAQGGTGYAYAPFDVPIFAPGVGTDGQVLTRIAMTRAVKFPAGAASSYAVASANAYADTTFTFYKNGGSFCTCKYAASGATGAFTQASDAVFAAGDLLEVDGPATADTTLADVGITLFGERTA